ncbi:DUF1822 family protein [Aerosakkonema funiforme]|uniref:DUF1822 family protein n=1 Tax=Aerosakkonema funiforme TaxID=1246630 RepID=UPI0035B7F4E9
MQLKLKELIAIDTEQAWLQFLPEDEQEAWPQDEEYGYEAANWNAYLNRLCLNAFGTWIKEYLELPEKLEVWPNEKEFFKLWELVNGTAIQLGETRIVLIPSEAVEIEEFYVQQEWIDIPSWVADYYILMQINPENKWLRILGYATHKMLKQDGKYNKNTHSYCLERDDLIEDINIMWMAREFCPHEQVNIEPIPKLSLPQVKDLLKQVNRPLWCSPRLTIKEFKQWGGILAEQHFREELYHYLSPEVVPALAITSNMASNKLVNLRQWLQRSFEAGWQPIEEILGSGGANLAFAFRSGQTFRKPTPNNPATIHPVTEFLRPEHDEETRLKTADFLVQVDPNNSEAIATLIDLLHTSQSGWLRLKAAENLGRISVSNTEAIDALTTILHSSQDDDLRWQAALSLGRIDPSNPAGGVDRGRLIDLGMQVAGHPVALIIDIRPESDGEVGVFLRVCPTRGQTHLPPNLELIVMDESGEVVDQAQARSADNWIQLQFSVELGDRFSIKVALGDASYTQNFVA